MFNVHGLLMKDLIFAAEVLQLRQLIWVEWRLLIVSLVRVHRYRSTILHYRVQVTITLISTVIRIMDSRPVSQLLGHQSPVIKVKISVKNVIWLSRIVNRLVFNYLEYQFY